MHFQLVKYLHESYERMVAENDMVVAHCSSIVAESLAGKRGSEQQMLAAKGLAWVELILKKNKDYGSSVFEAPMLAPNCDMGTGILVRMSDKINRLQQLAKNKAEVAESFDDTIRDLGAYCLLYLCSVKS